MFTRMSGYKCNAKLIGIYRITAYNTIGFNQVHIFFIKLCLSIKYTNILVD